MLILPVLEFFFLTSLPALGHRWLMDPETSGQLSPSQLSWKSSAVVVETGAAALRAVQSSVSKAWELGKVMSSVLACPRTSRMGKKATP